jgi:hypothetical protein
MLLALNKIIGIRRVISNTWGPPQHLLPPISSHGRRRTLTLQLHHGRSVIALLVALALRARLRRTSPSEGRFDYLLVESTRISEPRPAAELRLGRRTVLTFPLLPPPQKN